MKIISQRNAKVWVHFSYALAKKDKTTQQTLLYLKALSLVGYHIIFVGSFEISELYEFTRIVQLNCTGVSNS